MILSSAIHCKIITIYIILVSCIVNTLLLYLLTIHFVDLLIRFQLPQQLLISNFISSSPFLSLTLPLFYCLPLPSLLRQSFSELCAPNFASNPFYLVTLLLLSFFPSYFFIYVHNHAMIIFLIFETSSFLSIPTTTHLWMIKAAAWGKSGFVFEINQLKLIFLSFSRNSSVSSRKWRSMALAGW